MSLYYKRSTLIGLAILTASMGLAMLLIALRPGGTEVRYIRLIALLLGPTGARMFILILCIIILIAAMRLVWLTFDEALAARIAPGGIFVRSVYCTEFLPWTTIGGISFGLAPDYGKRQVLTIVRRDEGTFISRLALQGNRIVVVRSLLRADDGMLSAWLDAAEVGKLPLVQPSPVVASPSLPRFGKRIL